MRCTPRAPRPCRRPAAVPMSAFSVVEAAAAAAVSASSALLFSRRPREAPWLSLPGAGPPAAATGSAELGSNHFNANPDSSAWTFAAQAKVGARMPLGDSGAYLFGEYRYLYIGAVNQVFGSTVYPGHVPTSPWTASFGGTSNHLAAAGVGFSF